MSLSIKIMALFNVFWSQRLFSVSSFYRFLSLVFISFLLVFPCLEIQTVFAQTWGFSNVTDSANLKASGSTTTYKHGYQVIFGNDLDRERRVIAGGVASGDYDGDGWVDLYVVHGTIGPNLLFRNKGDGTFEEVGAPAGVALTNTMGSGPVFADVDGDGWLDLFVGGVGNTRPSLFRNLGNGKFEDFSATSGLNHLRESFSAAFGDYDRDGDLDIFITHWIQNPNNTFGNQRTGYLFQNSGLGFGFENNGRVNVFKDVSVPAGISGHLVGDFTPNFVDINNDGWPDLLIAADFLQNFEQGKPPVDFGGSQIFLNNQDGTFTNITDQSVINDQNGMGAAIADYDHDGDLDWFVSSIKDPNSAEGNWGISGNRFYRNTTNDVVPKDYIFEDVTDTADVREGRWGWGSCFGDFDNDGHPDLYHVNGFSFPQGPPAPTPPVSGPPVAVPPDIPLWPPVTASQQVKDFGADLAVFFRSRGDGTFEKGEAETLGFADNGQGRGLVCFDYDRDGDLDVFIANNQSEPSLYQNNLNEFSLSHYIDVKLKGLAPNTEGIGARVRVTTGSKTQMQEFRAGSNFESQDPALAHFGLGTSTVIDQFEVTWPDGATTTLKNVAVDQYLTIEDEATPELTWPTGTTNGVSPDVAKSGDTLSFQVTYTDPENKAPTQRELWLDQNDDGVFAEGIGQIFVRGSSGGGNGGAVPGVLLAFIMVFGLMLLSWWTDVSLKWVRLSSVIFFCFVFAGGCGGGGGSAGNDPTPTTKTERFIMSELDPADQDFTDGKTYLYVLTVEPAGDGTLNYRFVFNNGIRAATGDPAENQSVTIN